jgi:branched-chain amino acid aminotransferase
MYYNQETIIYNNGIFDKATNTTTDLYGQTLHYGYGVFEGIRAYHTSSGVKVFKALEHYERLKKSCELINIPFEFDIDELIDVTYQVLEKNNIKDGYIRPLIYCDPNMSLTVPTKVNIMICAWEWGAYLGEKLLNISFSTYCRPHPRSTKIEAKACGNYINSILASTEAKQKGYDEALLLDSDGFLAEGPGANLFFEKDGKLFTPKTGNILPGITRATILELCKKNHIEVIQDNFLPENIKNADSAFYCGTAAEIIGFNKLDDYQFPLAWENSIGKKLKESYLELVKQ